MSEKQNAERMLRIWRSGADKAAAMGVGEAAIGKSLVAIGLERWARAEPSEEVAHALTVIADELLGVALAEVGLKDDGKPTPRH